MPGPRVSVVVPFHNNEDLLADCLASIAAQSVDDLEVIMVDDGSADGSAAIAAAQAAADPRFTLIQVPNGGPGYARNQGVARARGEYLSFVDADDVLPADSLERMLRTLQESGSDLVSGGVLRIGPDGRLAPSPMHARAVKTRLIGTHISRNESLFFDVSVWNKMFRKSFWDGHDLRFPEGMVWEDLQLMTKAHVLARAVDTIPDTIYYWRERDKGPQSITQSRTSIQNFRDRITALLAIDAFLRERGPARLVAEHQRKALFNDLWLYVPDLSRTSPEYLAEFIELTGEYLSQVDKKVLRKLPSTHRLGYHLAGHAMADQLLEYSRYLRDNPLPRVPVVRERGRLRADLPYRNDARLAIPSRVYAVGWRELDPMIAVEAIDWRNSELVITGYAYVPSIDIRERWQTTKILVLRPLTKGRPPIIVPVTSQRNLAARATSGQTRYDYDWAGFRCAISPKRFRLGGRWLTGTWDAFMLVRGRGTWRAVRVHSAAPREAGPEGRDSGPGGPGVVPRDSTAALARQVAPGLRLGAGWAGLRLHVRLDRTPAELHGCELDGNELIIEADVRFDGDLALGTGQDETPRSLTTTATPLPDDGLRLRAAVPADLLLSAAEWRPYVVPIDGRPQPVAFPPAGEYRFGIGHYEVAVEPSRDGSAAILRRTLRPVIDEGSWSADGRLTLGGSYSAEPGRPYEAVLSRQDSTEMYVLPLPRDGSRFSLGIDAPAMPLFGTARPLRNGTWQVSFRPAAGTAADTAGDRTLVPVCDRPRLAGLTDAGPQLGGKTYALRVTGEGHPVLVVGTALRFADAGPVQRKLQRDIYYPARQRRPLRDAVVFISFQGKQCSDNPLGISDELRRRGDGREHIWVVNDWSVPVPDGASSVLAHTQAYWDALARSKYVISNDDMPARFTKRPGQMYVQTWHGTLLKKIGFDVPRPQFAHGSRYNEHLARDAAKWDLLLSPNQFSTPIMRRAFRYEGEICESGYPRNDVLRHPDSGKIAARVRERLGLPAGKRVLLYAPTWRDNQYDTSGRYKFDFELDLASAWRELGDDYVILVRGHHLMADDMPAGGQPGFVLNVSAYPDIAELFLASDALITDYSSVMCDFAVTGKPILCYTYDLQDYRDNLRGFYLDFESEVPGPLLANSAEVIGAISDLDAVAASYRERYEAFTAKFCSLDDGKAGARACDRIFGS